MTRALALALLLLTGAAHASERELISFGLTPWFHMGPAWTTWGADPQGTVRNGVSIELTGQTLMVIADRIGIGVASGYYGVGGNFADTPTVSLTGVQVLPLFMVAVLDVLSIHLKGGYVFATTNKTEVTAGAVRFGGGLTFVFLRIHSGDLALAADVTHTRLVSVEPGTPELQFTSTSAQLGISFSFNELD